MKTAALVMAAGDSTRFNGHVKALLKVDGETLIQRTARQTIAQIGHNPTVISHLPDAFYGLPGFYPHKRRYWAETLLSTADLWEDKTIILQGDVYYTDVVIQQVFDTVAPITYFRNGGYNSYETYAVTFQKGIAEVYKHLLRSFIARADERGTDERRTWNTRFYQYLCDNGLALKTVIVPETDETTDFDNEKDYHAWLKAHARRQNHNGLAQKQ